MLSPGNRRHDAQSLRIDNDSIVVLATAATSGAISSMGRARANLEFEDNPIDGGKYKSRSFACLEFNSDNREALVWDWLGRSLLNLDPAFR